MQTPIMIGARGFWCFTGTSKESKVGCHMAQHAERILLIQAEGSENLARDWTNFHIVNPATNSLLNFCYCNRTGL